ncbi:MAG TPA: HEPN domain-containing protein [Verrucomicrobiae bacterium]|nr:HEPN domain-containing protein [Verrucomicrobiae bacterium]
MNKPRTIDGQWWIHGDDKPAHFGVLSFDPERGLELTVKIPQDRNSAEAFVALFQAQGAPIAASGPRGPENTITRILERTTTGIEIPNVIHGRDEHNYPVTLFGCSCVRPGVSTGLDVYNIDCLAAILDFQGNSWREACFKSARVNYTLLHDWMNPGGGVERLNKRQEIELNERARLEIEGASLVNQSHDEVRTKYLHYASFEFTTALTVRQIRDEYACVFQRLLCLLTGERVFIEEIRLFDAANAAEATGLHPLGSELLTPNSTVADARLHKHADEMIASFKEIEADSKLIVKRWFECHKRLEPVLDLQFAVLFGLVATLDSEFLFLAQAMEVYHARSNLFRPREMPNDAHRERVRAILEKAPDEYQDWLKEKLAFANQKTLAQRLGEILDLHRTEAEKLIAGINDFAAKVRYTRNYLTHYSEESRQSGKVARGNELLRITYALNALLKICMLKELGIHGEPIERIVRKHSRMRFVELDPG